MERLALGYASLLMLEVRTSWLTSRLLVVASHVSVLFRANGGIRLQDALVLSLKLAVVHRLQSMLESGSSDLEDRCRQQTA